MRISTKSILPANDAGEIIDTSPGFDFDIFAKLGIDINSLTDEIKSDRKSRQMQLGKQPVYRALSQTIPVTTGFGNVSFGGPTDGREWVVKLLVAVNGTYRFATSSGASGSGSGAAGVTVTGPASMTAVTGFDVTAGIPTAAGTVLVTLSGVAGGPYTYELVETLAGGGQLQRTLNLPVTGVPTLTVAADATGGAVSANLFGTLNGDASQITWYVGPKIPVDANSNLPNDMIRWLMPTPPFIEDFSADVLKVKAKEQLIAAVSNNTVSIFTDVIAVVLDQPIPTGAVVTVN